MTNIQPLHAWASVNQGQIVSVALTEKQAEELEFAERVVIVAEADLDALRGLVAWYRLLARAANNRKASWLASRQWMTVADGEYNGMGQSFDANGLPVETKELRDALEARLGGE